MSPKMPGRENSPMNPGDGPETPTQPSGLGLPSASCSADGLVKMEAQRPVETLAAEFPPDLSMEKEKVENLRVGDLVDLQSCPYLKGTPTASYEYAEVELVERETEGCVVVGYEGIDHVGYPIGTELLVCKLQNRGLPDETALELFLEGQEGRTKSPSILTVFPNLECPIYAEQGGVSLDADELKDLLASIQAHDKEMGYFPRKQLDANQISQAIHWKAEELGTPLEDTTDPDPRHLG